MFSFLLQLPRLLASAMSSAAQAIQQNVTQIVTVVSAVGLFTAASQQATPNTQASSNNKPAKTPKAPTTEVVTAAPNPTPSPETKANVANFATEQKRMVAEKNDAAQPKQVEPVNEVQHLSHDSVTFEKDTLSKRPDYSKEQKKLAEFVEAVQQTDMGRNLAEQAAKYNVDLVFDYTTEFNAYYNADEGQVALNGKYAKTKDKAEIAEAVFSLYEELGHVKHNTKDSLFVHDYVNKAEKPVAVEYFSPEGYFHVRRNEEATAKTQACMAMDEWSRTTEGKAFVEAYVAAPAHSADSADYMAQAFNTYREELNGRLDVPSRLLAASNTYLELMTNPAFTDAYDNLVARMETHDIWSHETNATFVEPTNDILQQAGKLTIAGQEYNILSNYVDLTEPVFRQYSATAVDCIQKKSQELHLAVPEFSPSDVSADGMATHFMPTSTMDFMMHDTGLAVTASPDTVPLNDQAKRDLVRTNFPAPSTTLSQNNTPVNPNPQPISHPALVLEKD